MALSYLIQPGGHLSGSIRVPGDKSISHRSIILGAIAQGTTRVSGFLEGEDALATINIFRALGVKIEGPENSSVVVHGVGKSGLVAPRTLLDCGNSGTTMRLMAGLLAAQRFSSILTGDSSLVKRPMRRVVEPLTKMGAQIETSTNGCAPLKITGNSGLCGIEYAMPVASAQVKSALLLAGLYASGKTCITERVKTRDHTEKMLSAFGYHLVLSGNTVCVTSEEKLNATDITIPSDISSATFFIVGASISPGSDLVLRGVGINPARTGAIEILRLMGADIELQNECLMGGEPVADIRVRYAPLFGIDIPQPYVAAAIDEFPALFIAAANAKGKTVLTGAHELRVKESDRIQVMADGLTRLGVNATPTLDGMIIVGSNYDGGDIDSHGDHRVAMSFAVAALRAKTEIKINDCANVATSFPGFAVLASALGLNISECSN